MKLAMSPSFAQPSTSSAASVPQPMSAGPSLHVEDLVLRLVQSNKDRHKLSPPWEGPYVITEILWPGAYKLKTIDGEVFTKA